MRRTFEGSVSSLSRTATTTLKSLCSATRPSNFQFQFTFFKAGATSALSAMLIRDLRRAILLRYSLEWPLKICLLEDKCWAKARWNHRECRTYNKMVRTQWTVRTIWNCAISLSKFKAQKVTVAFLDQGDVDKAGQQPAILLANLLSFAGTTST